MSQELANARKAGILLQEICHACSARSGWWNDVSFADPMLVPTKLMLVVSELAEAMEGHRKSLMDDKLPHRTMLEVELADAAIRIFDLAGALEFDLGEAIAEKLNYNAQRPDHKLNNRAAVGGKAY